MKALRLKREEFGSEFENHLNVCFLASPPLLN